MQISVIDVPCNRAASWQSPAAREMHRWYNEIKWHGTILHTTECITLEVAYYLEYMPERTGDIMKSDMARYYTLWRVTFLTSLVIYNVYAGTRRWYYEMKWHGTIFHTTECNIPEVRLLITQQTLSLALILFLEEHIRQLRCRAIAIFLRWMNFDAILIRLIRVIVNVTIPFKCTITYFYWK